jgi:uncharacterized protein (DUF1330 family)
MTAYIIMIRERTRDGDAFAEYSKLAREASKGHSFEPLAFYGNQEVLEGPSSEGVVVLAFPDVEAARNWYESPAYAEARAHRHQGADYRVMLVEGVQ